MVTRFRPRVGRARLNQSVGATTRQDTMNVRAAMESIIKNYEDFVEHLEEETPEILEQALEPTFEISQKYVPEDTGTLKKSGYLRTTVFRGIPTVEIGYGLGGKPDYAATVHENLEFYHKPPTQAKFLQRALEEDANNVQNRIVFLYREAGGI